MAQAIRQATAIQQPGLSTSNVFNQNFAAGAGIPVDNEPIEDEPLDEIEGLPNSTLYLDNYRHLMQISNPKKDNPPVCLFQETGDCGGSLINGWCCEHLALLNISFTKGKRKIFSEETNNRSKVFSYTVPTAIEPGQVNPSANYYRIFPIIELLPQFDSRNFSIGYYSVDQSTLNKITRMSQYFSSIVDNTGNTQHFNFWRNYISGKFMEDETSTLNRSKNPIMYASQTRAQSMFILNYSQPADGGPVQTSVLNLKNCTLPTQTLLSMFAPQIVANSSFNLMSPANMQIIDGYLCMNLSLIPFGTDIEEQTIGTILRINTAQSVRYIGGNLSSSINIEYKYKTPSTSSNCNATVRTACF